MFVGAFVSGLHAFQGLFFLFRASFFSCLVSTMLEVMKLALF